MNQTTNTMENIQNEILEILEKKLKNKFVFGVEKGQKFFSKGGYLKIWIACSNVNINSVNGQKPQIVSLMLDLTSLELHPQSFGGNGGQCIFINPNLEDAKEKYLAMKSVKIPFRKPTQTTEKIKECIIKFIDNYVKTLKENKDVLKYKNIVNYDEVLS